MRALLELRATEEASHSTERATGPQPCPLILWPEYYLGRVGSPRAARTFFRSLTWPVMTATTYILIISSVLQSRKAGSTWPLTMARTGAGILTGGDLGKTGGGRVASPVAVSSAGGGGESSAEACRH